ncbi:MAG TPA: O-antigen ligase family protein, partial [Anaerolineales bacterium]
RTYIGVFTSLFIVLAYVLLIGSVFLLATQRDWRLSLLISNPPTIQEVIGVLTLNQNTLLDLSHRFIFLERMVYWFNGWNVFSRYPWLGVGLGNAGFFFPQMAPAIGWSSFEIRNVLYYLAQLPNVKSFWFRLLAETGLVGFSIFITWFYILFQSSRYAQHHRDASIKTFALAGQLALLAFIGEGFSIDSFAMPYFWIVAGLVAATGMFVRRELSQYQASA